MNDKKFTTIEIIAILIILIIFVIIIASIFGGITIKWKKLFLV